MATPELSSQLSYGEILKIYQDHTDYDLLGSLERARVFIKAGRMMLAMSIRRSGQASRAEEIELEPEILERQTKAAIAWLAGQTQSTTGVTQYIPAASWRDE